MVPVFRDDQECALRTDIDLLQFVVYDRKKHYDSELKFFCPRVTSWWIYNWSGAIAKVTSGTTMPPTSMAFFTID